MSYFVTGATGFIGRHLIPLLMARSQDTIYVLVRESSLGKLDELKAKWGDARGQIVPVIGDVTMPQLGVKTTEIKKLKGKIKHLLHLAAIYDLKASDEDQQVANVEGTRNAAHFAEGVKAGCFHLVSSIAAAGLYEGIFREDMFDEAENLQHPYFRTKHDSEAIIRKEYKGAWRIYRPGLVVGDSKTGEIDKIDGPYYFFKLIQKYRKLLPPWMPTIGIDGGRINLVPVDYVVKAIDHIAHVEGQDGKCFHLTDTEPYRVGEILEIFARAAHAPHIAVRLNTALFGFIPPIIKQGMMMLTPVRRIRDVVMRDLGLPPDIMRFVNYPTRFDNRDAAALLKPAGIKVPRLQDYAWVLWDYWERHLDPDLHIDRTLNGAVKGKTVLITGGSQGIGLAAALKIAQAGGKLILVARDPEKLSAAKTEIEAVGGEVVTYSCDLANLDEIDAMLKLVLDEQGGVDVLINNAGRSIRRGIEHSYDRFHDYQRTMQLNYFGCLRLTMGLMPHMASRRKGHVINISSIGVLTNAPRFSAYVASKAALDAFTRCAASEFADKGIEFTTINMPLVKTAMTAPTKLYQNVPMATPDEAADLIAQAIIYRPQRIATKLGIFAQVVHALMPKVSQVIMNTSYRMFGESDAALGKKEGGSTNMTPDQIAFTQIMKGIYM
ncbi:SDR family oxidoreductase [Chitinivorax sp. B]|uniref:SDR family oxidoreductase n=1 Tax=Chitinivorax sp. B TaxID=2502235 RepID=UPI0010F60ED8|nr:SDR family oxidoreductase [Chitinivorax sp. B]